MGRQVVPDQGGRGAAEEAAQLLEDADQVWSLSLSGWV